MASPIEKDRVISDREDEITEFVSSLNREELAVVLYAVKAWLLTSEEAEEFKIKAATSLLRDAIALIR